MTDLAPHLSAFLQEYLPNQRQCSRHTLQGYTECFRLLVTYTAQRIRTRPCKLKIEHFTVALLSALLDALEKDRNNSVGHAQCPPCRHQVVLPLPGIPCAELPRPRVAGTCHTAEDRRQAADRLARSDRNAGDPGRPESCNHGRSARPGDAASVLCRRAAGVELTTLTLDSVSGPQIETLRILGKGRRERELPMWKETRIVLNQWLDVRPPVTNRYMFLNARGRAMSTDGFAYLLDKHVATAAKTVASIKTKRVTPHVLRHSAAMAILHATGDIRKVSLWLGHADLRTTEMYVRASPAEKLRILETNTPPSIRPGTFPGVRDSLMELLGGK